MKKYFKKFGIMFVMTLILSLGFCISAFAATDDGVVGTSNLNGTAQNSAKIGDQLKLPEVGWKRYDDTDGRLIRTGIWMNDPTTNGYDGNLQYTNETSSTLTFKFYGKKLRIISAISNVQSSRVQIIIDGNSYYSSNYSSTVVYQSLLKEFPNLSTGVHTVTMNSLSAGDWNVEAIDIDDTGSLIDPNESISLDKSTIDMTEGETQKLTATTTPAGAQVTWTSSDDSIATVDENGIVKGIKEGQVTITGTTADGLTATCTVTVSSKGTEPSNPTTGDANLYIELVDGQIKQYTVSSDEINKFTEWYENRDNDHSLKATYKFTKGTYTDYVVHDQIDWFEVR